MRHIVAYLLALVALGSVFLTQVAGAVFASEPFGIHILQPDELEQASALLKDEENPDAWHYVTIPFTLNDLDKQKEWQHFFDKAKEHKFQPIVRLTTKFENGAWKVPTRKEIVDMARVLDSLQWPQENEKILVVFNEPNHRAEWGGTINPEEYAGILQFTADWFHWEQSGFVVLPAGLDLAAPNGPTTMEAFAYLDRMIAAEPMLLDSLDGWTSHSYPNPGFSAAPQKSGKMGLRGYQEELAFLKKYTGRTYPVYITETGWVETQSTSRWLVTYYSYAVKHVWSDSQIKAVTPFVLRGAPGTFAQFSFYDAQGKPTRQFQAYKGAIEKR